MDFWRDLMRMIDTHGTVTRLIVADWVIAQEVANATAVCAMRAKIRAANKELRAYAIFF